MEPGLEAAIAAFRAATGQAVGITYAIAPRLRELLLAGEAPDVLVAPLSLLEEIVPRLGAGELLLRWLAGPEARRLLDAAGVEK